MRYRYQIAWGKGLNMHFLDIFFSDQPQPVLNFHCGRKKKVILRIYFLGSMGSKTHFKHLYFFYFFFSEHKFGGAILGRAENVIYLQAD